MIFQRDPCGIFCILLTYTLISYADYVVIGRIVMDNLSNSLWGAIHAILFNIIIFIQIFSHMRAVTADPGIVPLPSSGLDFSDHYNTRGQESKQLTHDEWTICQRCETYRPPRAHHCKICRRCIRRMDHHCPWVNNCIGEQNQKFFIQFLFYTALLCVYAISLDFFAWIKIIKSADKEDFAKKQTDVAHGIGLCIEALLFGLFVFAMLYDQITSIFDDETGVEYTIHKSRKTTRTRPRKPKMALLREVFGYGPLYTWFLPCSTLEPVSSRSFQSSSYDV